ncbi:large ribosomal subunit protein bL17m-like [Amphiura filiformis]|uniref:large ribosomal subunit protein bL17m-like n=1 Tax=Amphiura filiformis TaxID=82378 RepID=UPI003B219B3C
MRHGKLYRNMAGGPENRMRLLRTLVNALVKFERIETPFAKAHETQKYAERLIKIAKKGEKDADAMKVADYYLADKKLVHKLFKVLAPRFADKPHGFTRLLHTPGYNFERRAAQMTFLEFKGNPYPPLQPHTRHRNRDWLLNVLVRGAMKDIQEAGVLQEAGYHPNFIGTRVVRSATDKDFSDLRNKLVDISLEDTDRKEDTHNEGTPV